MSTSQAQRADRKPLLLAAALVLLSQVVYWIAYAFHPESGDPNNHPAIFVVYANSQGWTADHVAWFIETGMVIVGALVLLHAVDPGAGMASIVARIGAVLASVSLALTGLRYAVDGVVLKRAVDAWVAAPDAEKAATFAAAQVARWFEEASASYQGFVFGLTLVLLAVVIFWTARAPRPVALFLALGGIGYVVQGWVLGESGFAPQGAIPNYFAAFSPLIAALWLLVAALRMPRQASQRSAQGPANLATETTG